MSETKHTPTPWKPSRSDLNTIWSGPIEVAAVSLDETGEYCPLPEVADANRAFIIRAVNCHDDLLSCLIEFVQCVDGEHTLEMYRDARAAIARAETT